MELQAAGWSPTGGLALVQDCDLYYRARPDRGPTQRVTQDGRVGQVCSGVPDWVYRGTQHTTPTFSEVFYSIN